MNIQFPKEKLRVLLEGLLVLAVITLLWTVFRPKEIPVNTPSTPITAASVTPVDAVPKTSASDDDVVVTRTYTANVDGQRVIIPFNPVTAPNGMKGIIKQEIDFTPVVNKMAEAQSKNWSLGIGIGTHDGDIYIPIEVEKTIKKTPKVDTAVAVEVHLAPQVPPKVNGGEVKVKWRY